MSIRRPNWRVILAAFCCVGLMLAPALAEARAGTAFGSHPSSVGSRGWRSYENKTQPSWSQPSGGLGARAPGFAGNLFQRHPFLTGLAGGILGSWLFGHAGFGIGGLLRLLLIGLAIWLVVRLLRRMRSPSAPPGSDAMATPRSAGAAAVATPPGRGRDINLPDADLYQFQQIHAQVQDAWSAADLARLRPLMTPEMLRWFSEELGRNASRGVQNIVSGVKLLKGELIESWDEGDRQFATALLRWRAVDYNVEVGKPRGQGEFVTDGDPRAPVEVEEIWTFVRRRGGTWLLSAIQQV
jgi:predicted lipid-binding transport protein (Tim44 family)